MTMRRDGDTTTLSVAESYRWCGFVARRAASNFYWSFWLLPPEKRRAMVALYAFSRHSDDLADDPTPGTSRVEALAHWRMQLEAALAGDCRHPILPALMHAVRRYSIPPRFLYDVIEGVQSDLTPHDYQTYDELRDYCQLVASAVGLACLHIWGFGDEAAYVPAVECGIAFQWTNILRDLREDAQRGRVYVPQEDLRRFGYSSDGLRRGQYDDAFRNLLQFEIERAEQSFVRGWTTRDYLTADGRRAFDLMFGIYHRLLGEIRRRSDEVLVRRIRLNWSQKAAVAVDWCLGRALIDSPPLPCPASSTPGRTP